MATGRPTESAPCPQQGDVLPKQTTSGATLSPSEGNVDQPISSGFPGKRGPLKFFNLPRSAWIRLQSKDQQSYF
ncbi:hypothetical protein L596_012565 [Steinernema carpocapsae]|uniref:Uncharacterized protein n=1 Tax=Steinernema carpocapsae TaxID=34508 RepID=A0A4U5NYB8_STECR|nr:hypothetical protein L596_012565 [Steinernema carpocapsae]